MEERELRRGFADTPEGPIHYAEAGSGPPVLCLHQTPRSWDEFRDVIPRLGRRFRALAMDTVGYGDSYRPAEPASIEGYARAVVRFLDAMQIGRTSLVGHHTGGVIALEVAAVHPERVERLVLSSCPYVDAAERARRKGRPLVDDVPFRPDGGHLPELWAGRRPYYPPDRADLTRRFVLDALKAGERLADGHRAVSAYAMELKAGLVRAPTLVLAGSEDPFSFPGLAVLAEAVPGSRTAVLEGGMVPMVDQMPEAFAETVLGFLAPRDGPQDETTAVEKRD